MPRKNLQNFCEEIALNPNAVRELFRRIKAWIELDPNNRTEVEGFGVFYARTESKKLIKSGSDFFVMEQRSIAAMRPPRRRRSTKFTLSTTDWVSLFLYDSIDGTPSEVLYVSAGAVRAWNVLFTPVNNYNRAISVSPENAGKGFNIHCSYERFRVTTHPSGTWESRNTTVTYDRKQSSLLPTRNPTAAWHDVVWAEARIRSSSFSTQFETNAGEIQTHDLDNPPSNLVSHAAACMAVLRGEL